MVPVSGYIKEEFYNFEPVKVFSANKVKDGTDGTLPTLIYKDAIDAICQFNVIIDHNIFIGNTLLQPHDEYREVIRAQIKAWGDHFDK